MRLGQRRVHIKKQPVTAADAMERVRSLLSFAAKDEQKPANPDGGNTCPERNIDRFLLLRGEFNRPNFDHRGVSCVAEAAIDEPKRAGDD